MSVSNAAIAVMSYSEAQAQLVITQAAILAQEEANVAALTPLLATQAQLLTQIGITAGQPGGGPINDGSSVKFPGAFFGSGPTITATAGTPQSTARSSPFTTALQVTVKDAAGNLLNALVTFTAPSTGASGIFGNGNTPITVNTNSAGVAQVTFTANSTAGSYTVTASIPGSTTPASFSLTNT